MRLLAILAGLAAAAAKPTRTKRKPGLLIVGLGGNNGATVLAGLHANNTVSYTHLTLPTKA